MPSVREFFLAEAGGCLRGLEEVVQAPVGGGFDPDELLRLARMLRGSAQMAREDQVLAVAQALESGAKAIAERRLPWSDEIKQELLATLADLKLLVGGELPVVEAEARVRQAVSRWRRPGIDPVGPAPSGLPTTVGPGAGPGSDFVAYAAKELGAILAAFDRAIPVLELDARDREPLKSILRSQRALLGAARLDSIPPLAEALRAVDEVSRLIARHDAPVEGDWLEVFRLARAVLADVAPALEQGGVPAGPALLPELRALRTRLLERFGSIPDPRRAGDAAAGGRPADAIDFFRREAGLLLDRVERMSGDLSHAPPDRQAMLRREIQGVLTALRDTALSLGFGHTAVIAETALARALAGTAAVVQELVPTLRRTVAADRPIAPPGAAEAPARAAAAGVEHEARRDDAPPAPQSAAAAVDAQTPGEEVVPIESLFYRGNALRRRIGELRLIIDRAIGGDATAREALEELCDLIHQELK